ncbi:DEAD/DEAH box helicase [Flexistipes sp.]|uniref:DEAD/DEAH box helicase n=1 Tax=Flexistipes sp. TaxID=3088135 RepID=UPI002E1D5D38|nr:helicase-related protein [Flexistipes sp.]
MNVGDEVKSRLYQDKGIAIVIGFDEIFGEKHVELLFGDGSRITTKYDDIIQKKDTLTLLSEKQFENPLIFMVNNLLLKIEENLSEDKVVTSANFKIKPLPHQLLVTNFVINKLNPRCLIADEVGLGKTIEAALVYEELKLRGFINRTLIVVPSGLITQWHEELSNKFNEQFVIYSKEYVRALKQSYGEETNVWTLHDNIIASIDSVKPLKIHEKLSKEEKKRREWHNRHIYEDIGNADFDIVIIDEAHKLSKKEKGDETARYKVGKSLSERIPIMLLLTATPHQGDAGLFLNLLRLIDPFLFINEKSLIPEIINEVAVRNKKRAAVDFDGNRIFKDRITSIIEIKRNENKNRDEIELYNKVTEYTQTYYNIAKEEGNKAYILLVILYQRIVSSSSFAVLASLKRRLNFLENYNERVAEIQNHYNNEEFDEFEYSDEADSKILEIEPLNEKYLEVEKRFIKECIALAERVTRNFSDVKFEYLLETVNEICRREGKADLKFIIFTEFKATQEAIIKYLDKLGYSCALLHGGLSREERINQIEDFRENSQFLVSTDAGGEGINLQFCYCMINFDLPWNPARLEQRIGRIDRIGQEKDVRIFNFQLKGTVEDRVREILETKLELIKTQYGDDKYSDVLSLLEDEFSFDKIYVDAFNKLEALEKEINIKAEEIYNRANEILKNDELMLPFSNFEENAEDLLNNRLQFLVKQLVFDYLKYRKIDINKYKEYEDMYFFHNPFPQLKNLPNIFRKVAFKPDIAIENQKAEIINIKHPIINLIKNEIRRDSLGKVSALKVRINKFEGISGVWFVFKLNIGNNVKSKTFNISVFMEDDEFYNWRISRYLDENVIEKYEPLRKITSDYDFHKMYAKANEEADAKAEEIFISIKNEWMEGIEKYERKLFDYYQFKRNSITEVAISNIRESRLRSITKEKENQLLSLEKQKNIIPKIQLSQAAFLEFE